MGEIDVSKLPSDNIGKKCFIGLVDADLLDNGTRHPNLVIMKLAGYCREHGFSYELLYKDDTDVEMYEHIYVSKVFTFTKLPSFLSGCQTKHSSVHFGGTGFYAMVDDMEEFTKLRELDMKQLENDPILPGFNMRTQMPYYDVYHEFIELQLQKGRKKSYYKDYLDYSIGFYTRGCFRQCSFCVNKGTKKVEMYSDLKYWVDENRSSIYLWDDNILGAGNLVEDANGKKIPLWEKCLDDLMIVGKPFQFRQGLDMRLMTEKMAEKLSKCKYHGDFIFAFDHIKDKELIEKKLSIWRKYCRKETKFYVLVAYDGLDENDVENAFERIKILMSQGCLPYIMRYEAYKDSRFKTLYTQLARWCNQPNFLKKTSFRQYCVKNEEYHRKMTPNAKTNCSCYQSMIDFEKEFPEIASKYYDLRWEEINRFIRNK